MARPKLEEDRVVLNRSERPNRVPINGFRDRLAVDGKEVGWHYCWVNDYEVDRYLAGLYEYVTHAVTVGHKRIDAGSGTGSNVSIPVGNGVTAYLMRIPQEIHEEDQRNMDAEVSEREDTMREELNSKKDGRYGSVDIKVGSRSFNRQ